MGAPRRFDHDEARRLRAQGLTYHAIGLRLGVSDTAVARACDPRVRRNFALASRRRLEAQRTPCRGGCGLLVWTHRPGHSGYCRACLGERRNVARHGTETEYNQGCRCEACTAAATTARRRRRENTRVPCSHGCGTLVDSTNRRDRPPECRPCAMARIHAERRQAALS